MTYCHTTAQLNRHLDEIDLLEQREFAIQTIREEVEREIMGGGCRYFDPKLVAYRVVDLNTVRERAELTEEYGRIADWYADTDSERTRQRLGAAYIRLLERKCDELVEEVTNAIFYHGGGM
jgi:hypothetical protein